MTTAQILRDRKATKEAQLIKLNATYDKMVESDIDSYSFDSGDGRQSTKKRKLEDIRSQITQLEADIDAICRKLEGKGLVAFNLNRSRR